MVFKPVTLFICVNRGKKRIRKGQKVEFSVVSQEGGKYRASEVNLV